MRFSTLLALTLATATPAAALEIVSVTDPAEVAVASDYKILGVQPGDTFEEIKAAANENGIGIAAQKGTLKVTLGDRQVAVDLTFGFNTPGYENQITYRYEDNWNIMSGSLTSDATGNVATAIYRSVAYPLASAPAWESVLKQLTETYGEPTLMEGTKASWITDKAGETMAPGTLTALPESCGPGTQFTYAGPDYVEAECGVIYSVAYVVDSYNTQLNFGLIDFALRDADRIAASAQIDAPLPTGDDVAPTELKF